MNIANFDKFNNGDYCEIGQSNPIRWMNLKPLADGTFEAVTHWWKCKDFMNEVVTSRYLKKEFKIYGFVVNPETFFSPDQQGLYFLLKGVLPAFQENIEKVLNPLLVENDFPPVEVQKAHEEYYFLRLPEIYRDNTHFMSVITLYIRLCNAKGAGSSLDELVKRDENRGDPGNYAASLKKPMWKMPKKLKDYIWYYNKEQNCRKDGSTANFGTSMMHNCGVVSWGWE